MFVKINKNLIIFVYALTDRVTSRFLNLILIFFKTLALTACVQEALILPEVSSSTISGKIFGSTASSSSGKVQSQQNMLTTMGCVAPTAWLHKLDDSGNRIEPALEQSSVDADGSYSFNVKNLGIGFQATFPKDKLLISVTGCSSGVFLRPITGPKEQNVTMGSTVISYLLNTNNKDRIALALKNSPSDLQKLIDSLDSSTTLNDAYTQLENNVELKTHFSQVFGVPPTALDNASPEVLSHTLPSDVSELVSTRLAVAVSHFSPTYQSVYEWKLDGAPLSQQGEFIWTPHANLQGTHQLSVLIGENDGSGRVNLSKPTKTLSETVIISNNVLPTPPPFVISSPVIVGSVPINNRLLTIAINTGNAFANCASFSKMALTENNQTPPEASAFNIDCLQSPTQSINFSISSSGDGLKSISLWTMDATGEISATPTDVIVNLDTGSPTAAILTTPLALSNSPTQTFQFSATDNGGVIDHYSCKLNSGIWGVCSSPHTYSSLTEGAYTFSLKAVDTAGNESIVASRSWHVDLTPPSLNLTTSPSSLTQDLSGSFVFSATDSGGSSVAGYLCNIDGAGYVSCSSPLVNVFTAGAHQIAIKATDTAGNTSAVQSYSWTIDNIAPSASITAKPTSTSNLTSATFSFSGSDTGGGSVASFECQLDGNAFTSCTSPKIYSGLNQGSHTFSVRATDTATNTGTSTSYTWTIDTTVAMPVLSSAPNSLENSSSASFSFTMSGAPASSYQCKLDNGAYTTCTSPQTYTALTEGDHTFAVRALDNASNMSSPATASWRIDHTAPILSLTTTPSSLNNSTSVSFAFSSVEANGLSAYSCKLDSGSFSTCSSPVSYSTLSQGSHTFQVTSTDLAGNVSSASSFTWTTDLTAPSVSVSSSPNSITNSGSASFAFTGSDSGGGALSGFQCSLDGGAYATCTSGLSYTGLAAGAHQFSVVASDTAGNTSSASLHSWTIDQTAPTIGITSSPTTPTNSTSATFQFSSTDSGGGSITGFSCKLDSEAPAGCSSPYTVNSLAAGTHSLYLTATDSAGNTSSTLTSTWIVDLTAPTITITTPAGNGTIVPLNQLSNFTLSGTCSENGQPVAIGGSTTGTTTCSANTWSLVLDLSALADGTLSLTATHVDLAGNSLSTSARTVIKDTQAPTLSLATPSPVQANTGTGTASWVLSDSNIASGTSFAVEFFDGTSWASWGTLSATAGNNSNQTYTLNSLAVPNITTSSARFRVTISDAAGNVTTTSSSTFIVDGTPPVISSLIINDGATSTGLSFVNLKVTVTDSLSSVSYVRFANTTANGDCQNLYANTNWVAWTNSTTAINYNISAVDGTKKICVWAKDSLGNISTISPSSGTNGVTSGNIDYYVGNPPVITAFSVTNSSGQTTFNTGDTVNISWTVTDVEGLSNTPITLYKSVNGASWTSVATNYGSLSGNPTSYTSTYTSMTAPSGVFRVKLVATDMNGNTSPPAVSDVMNGTGWSVYMGSTETGVGGTGTSTSMVKAAYSVSGNQFAVNPTNGDIYSISHGRGVYKLSAATGLTSIFFNHNSTSNITNGITLSSSVVANTTAMALNFDKSGRLYISNPEGIGASSGTSVKIWQFDFTTNKFKVYLGGGTLPGMGSVLPSSATTAHVTFGAFDIDDTNNMYFFSTCDPSAFVMATASLKYRLLKVTQNTDGTAGTFSLLSGDCSSSSPIQGGLATSSGMNVLTYQHIRQMTTNSDGSLIYVSDNTTVNPTYKLVYDSIAGAYRTYSTTLGNRGLVFDRINNQMYVGNSSILKVTLNIADPTAAETTSTFVATNGTGDCDSDGVIATSACIYAYGSNGWAPLEMANDGTLLFTDSNFRIRYVDGNSKLRTIMGTMPFYGDGLNRTLSRGNFTGIYYKTSSLNTTDFPQGLYFLDSTAGVFGYINPADNTISILMGNQLFGGTFPVDGSVVSKYSNMSSFSGSNFQGLTFDSNGLPVLVANNKLVRLKAGKVIETISGGAYSAPNTLWVSASEGAALSTVKFNSYWSNYNLVSSGANYFFALGVNNQTSVGALSGAIGYINLTDSKFHVLMKGLSSGTQVAAADSSTATTVNSSSLSSSCYNSSCFLQYNNTDGALYFSEGNYIRKLTNPTSPTTVTLSTPTNLSMGRTVTNFTFSPDNNRVYYRSAGYLFCTWIGAGSAPANCQNTSLGPPTGVSTINAVANQFTFIQDGQLLISSGPEVYLYTYTP